MYSNKYLNSITYELGNDIFSTQGAGGNISIKKNDKLIIKASGKWMSDVYSENIFTEVDLKKILDNVKNKKYDFEIKSIKKNQLKPSIETIVHAIIPKKFIVHIHHINSIVHLIDNHFLSCIKKKLKNYKYKYSIINYAKPGAELAKLIHEKILIDKSIEVFLLKNHGVFFFI